MLFFVSLSFGYEARISLNILPKINLQSVNNTDISLTGNTDTKFSYIVYDGNFNKRCEQKKISDVKNCLDLKKNKIQYIILNPITY